MAYFSLLFVSLAQVPSEGLCVVTGWCVSFFVSQFMCSQSSVLPFSFSLNLLKNPWRLSWRVSLRLRFADCTLWCSFLGPLPSVALTNWWLGQEVWIITSFVFFSYSRVFFHWGTYCLVVSLLRCQSLLIHLFCRVCKMVTFSFSHFVFGWHAFIDKILSFAGW